MRIAHTLNPTTSATSPLKLKPGTVSLPVISILLRKAGDVRLLNAAHVVTLAESIAALGLLEPPVVDLQGYLLAGAHRLAALQFLAVADAAERRSAFLSRLSGKGGVGLADRVAELDLTEFARLYPKGEIPAMAADVSEAAGVARDLAIEAAENSVRRQYAVEEVKALAEKLKMAGYVCREGRPRTGEKSLRVALEDLLGRSGRHIKRLLGEEKPRSKKSAWEKAQAAFLRAAQRVREAGKKDCGSRAETLRKAAEMVVTAMEKESK